MIIIFSVCLCVLQMSGKTINIGGLNELLTDFKLYKDQNSKRLLLKSFRYKVMTIYIIRVYCSRLKKTPGDSQTHLNISATVSWLSLPKHCSKSITIEVQSILHYSNTSVHFLFLKCSDK